jgi:hypothetical protein
MMKLSRAFRCSLLLYAAYANWFSFKIIVIAHVNILAATRFSNPTHTLTSLHNTSIPHMALVIIYTVQQFGMGRKQSLTGSDFAKKNTIIFLRVMQCFPEGMNHSAEIWDNLQTDTVVSTSEIMLARGRNWTLITF